MGRGEDGRERGRPGPSLSIHSQTGDCQKAKVLDRKRRRTVMRRVFTFESVYLHHWEIEEAINMAWELWATIEAVRDGTIPLGLNYAWEDYIE
jgi:hypothetical protein